METLKLLFVLYFHILKSEKPMQMLSGALDGNAPPEMDTGEVEAVGVLLKEFCSTIPQSS